MVEIACLDHPADIEVAVGKAVHERLEPCAPLAPRQRTQVLAFDQQAVVEPNEGGKLLEHLLADGFAPEPLLQCVEARRAALGAALDIAADQQFAVEHRGEGEHVEQFGEGRRNIVARTGIDPGLVARPHQLDADTVPFPFCGVVGEIDHRFLQRMRQHEGAEGREIVDVGGRFAASGPAEQLVVGCIEPMPIFLHLFDRYVEGLRKGGLCQPRRHADPHAARRQLEQRIAARGIEPVEQERELG